MVDLCSKGHLGRLERVLRRKHQVDDERALQQQEDRKLLRVNFYTNLVVRSFLWNKKSLPD